MATVPRPLERDISRKGLSFGDAIFGGLMALGSLAIVAILIGMVHILANQSWDAINRFGFQFFTSQTWNPVTNQFGALSVIYGTVISSLIGVILAVPVAVGVALFLTEVSPKVIRLPASFLVEMLAAVPSVVFGLWGLFVLAPHVLRPVETNFLGKYFGWIPLFSGSGNGYGMLSAGVILAIMIIPIIAAISRDVLRAVPQNQREAALALGATKFEMIWSVLLPYARPGITGATILGLGRAVGETMAVTMVIGNAYHINTSLFKSGNTMASAIANNLGEADNVYRSALIELGLILLGVTLLINVAARLLVWRISRHAGGGVL